LLRQPAASANALQWHAACHQQADHAAASQQLTDWLVKQMLLED
jgi:hypothetical protein